MTQPVFPRHIAVSAEDKNGDPLRGVTIAWFVNGHPAGSARHANGHASMDVASPTAAISVSAHFRSIVQGPVLLAGSQTFHTFAFDVIQHPRWKDFVMAHFPALIGIIFVFLAIALGFVFHDPTPVQTRLIYALFALGGGGFGGEIAGFIKADLTLGQKLRISAGGAAAIFVILYFFAPAG